MKQENIFDLLKSCVDISGKNLLDAPWDNKDFYSSWLAQACYYVKHSTRLLSLTAAHIPVGQESMHYRFLKHCVEEKGHENLPVNDIKEIGKNIEIIPEFYSTKAFYQTQYYQIEHVNPLAFFGYILFLESMACDYGPEVTDVVDKIHGKKATSFMKVHTDADIEHVKDAIARVRTLPPEVQTTIAENIKLTHHTYQQIVNDCLNYKQNFRTNKVA